MVDCRKFLDSNALGLTVAALSSYDPQMRAAAYSILAAYYSHVEGARFRERSQVSGAEGGLGGLHRQALPLGAQKDFRVARRHRVKGKVCFSRGEMPQVVSGPPPAGRLSEVRPYSRSSQVVWVGRAGCFLSTAALL